MTRCRMFLLFLCVGLSEYISAQALEEHHFLNHTAQDGLSHNSCNGIAQDSVGYIWISTASGINRFDGRQFLQFHSGVDSTMPASEEVTGQVWIDKNRLAFYSNGLHIVNTITGTRKNLYIPCDNKLYQYKYNMIEKAMGDGKGGIYVLSRAGFYHFNKNYQLISRFDYYQGEAVENEHFFFGRDLFELDEQKLLIVSIAGLYIYDKKTLTTRRMVKEDNPLLESFLDYPGDYYTLYRFYQPEAGRFFIMKLLSDTIVYVDVARKQKVSSVLPIFPLRDEFHFRSQIFPVADTLFYITGHNGGVFRLHFNPVSGQCRLQRKKSLPGFMCSGIMVDHDQKIWVSTNKGLLQQHRGKSQVETSLLPQWLLDSFPNIKLDDVYVAGNTVIAGARNRGGLLLFDKRTFRFDKQIRFKQYDNRGNHITAITKLDESTLLLGTDWPLLQFDLNTRKEKAIFPPNWNKGDWISDLYRDSRGQIWISAFNIFRFETNSRQFLPVPSPEKLLSIPFQLEADKDGNIWMAGHGLARYNTSKQQFDMRLDSFPFIKMPDKQVNSIVVDNDSRLWFNSNNNGLLCYDPVSQQFRHFTRQDGLPDNNIASMIVIGSRLWMACYSGLACMDTKTFQLRSFGKEDGFPPMPAAKGARFFYDSIAQQLYLGLSSALVRFNPYELLWRNPPPRVFIENITVGNGSTSFLPVGKITTEWKHNELAITTGYINYTDGNNHQFAYRIRGEEPSIWHEMGNQPGFNISGLSPGQHRIQVRVSSLTQRWPPQFSEIEIMVLPPFWKKTGFLIFLFMVVAALIYLLVAWRTAIVRKKEMDKTNIQRIKAENYKSQYELEQISHYFSSSLEGKNTVDEVLWDVAGNLIGRMHYQDCMIYLWNEDKTRMIQKAAYGPKGNPESIARQEFNVVAGQGVVGYVMETLQPVLIPDTRLDARYRMDEMFRLSEICVPIIHNGELLGIIDSEHPEVDYFKERDLKILTTLATLIGNKLVQLESEWSLRAKREELATINEQLASARLSALQAQMNPHFVFNALNSIKRMILEADNEKASRYLSKFAMMIRMTLQHSSETFVSLEENLIYLRAYLEMEQLRFDESFQYEMEVPEGLDVQGVGIPSMVIQPLVENAIWHGLLPSPKEKRLWIRFRMEQGQIVCVIEDNGIGINQSNKLRNTNRPLHESLGLENLKNRMRIINEKFDLKCSLRVTDLSEIKAGHTGTRVVLRFNILPL